MRISYVIECDIKLLNSAVFARLPVYNIMKLLLLTQEEEDLPEPAMGRVMRMNAPEWPYILCGCIASIISGGIQPAFAVVFAEILGVSIHNSSLHFCDTLH